MQVNGKKIFGNNDDDGPLLWTEMTHILPLCLKIKGFIMTINDFLSDG